MMRPILIILVHHNFMHVYFFTPPHIPILPHFLARLLLVTIPSHSKKRANEDWLFVDFAPTYFSSPHSFSFPHISPLAHSHAHTHTLTHSRPTSHHPHSHTHTTSKNYKKKWEKEKARQMVDFCGLYAVWIYLIDI